MATTCMQKLKAKSSQRKYRKTEGTSENWVLTGKQIEDFRQKKENKNIIPDLSKKPRGTQGS